ncbi:MAG: hypothetical protein O3A01_08575 [bacterium]|nr:hypothetical protein [bacterium]
MTSLTARIENSRRLDVWKWSDHPKVHLLINDAYEYYFRGFKHPRAKQHVKVLLLDVFLAWNEDPTQSIGVSMRPADYSKNSTYKKIFITQFMIKVVNRAVTSGLIESWQGNAALGRVTRIWAAPTLIKLFRKYGIKKQYIILNHQKDAILIRDANGVNIDFKDEDFNSQEQWVLKSARQTLALYNELLTHSFIDIPSAISRRIKINRSDKKPSYLIICEQSKYVYRVFNNGSLDDGGRFYGGWWQNAPKNIRQKIFINGEETVEIDFSGLHINLLYAIFGLSLKDYPARKNPYQISLNINTDQETKRSMVKQLMLIALNAKDDVSALIAFRNWLVSEGLKSFFTDLKNQTLNKMCLQPLKQKHDAIKHAFASNAGISLMGADSTIMEEIIRETVALGIIVLPIHDSVIVQLRYQKAVEGLMKNAFKAFTKDDYAPMKTSWPKQGKKTNRYLAREKEWKEVRKEAEQSSTITGIAGLI